MRILLVEDDKLHLRFLREQVEKSLQPLEKVLVATSGLEAESLARSEKLSAVVMDLRIKGRSGIDAARVIWRERPGTRILFWSNYSNEAYLRGISRIVPAGSAYGYVLKTAPSDRLALALRVVLVEGQIMIDRELVSLQSLGGKRDALTDVEIAILHDVALGLSDKLVAQRHGLSLRTVQNRLMAIYDKMAKEVELRSGAALNLNKRARAIATGVKMGLVTSETLDLAERDLSRWLDGRVGAFPD